ncbi:hypothetical protein EDB87DRAFT_1172114 [Lactarius vividus]|nr:hypothetical protein EDB87DRAFT_1172114 [Lactarius vividus]
MILQALFILAFALLTRSKSSNQPEDAIHAAKYLRYLRNHVITTVLVNVLAFQVEFEARDVKQNIEEMAVLFHELLTSDASDDDNTCSSSITLFARVVSSKIRPWVLDQPLNSVIKCLRLARTHKPELRVVHFALAICLSTRFLMTFMNGDYEEATSILDEFITSSSPRDSQDEYYTDAAFFHLASLGF